MCTHSIHTLTEHALYTAQSPGSLPTRASSVHHPRDLNVGYFTSHTLFSPFQNVSHLTKYNWLPDIQLFLFVWLFLFDDAL